LAIFDDLPQREITPMLRRIDTSEVELGMFIQRLEGNWFSHPFWRKRFVLSDAGDLEALRQSSVAGVIIDESRGKQAGATRPTAVSPPQPSAPAPLHRAVPRPATAFRPPRAAESALPIAREFGEARAIADRSRKRISKAFLQARLGKGVAVGDVEPVVEEIYGSVQRNIHAFSGLMRCQRDKQETYRHALSVCALMIALARKMHLSPTETHEAGMTGLLMDVGVGRLPDSLEEVDGDYRALRQQLLDYHILFGHDMLCVAGDIPEAVLTACRNHHERMDGSGYPNGLKGEEIDLFSRMAAICDEFDYLVTGGFMRPPLNAAEAIEVLVADGEKFDPEILRAFIESVGIYPIGAFVKLRSGRVAMVVDVDPDDAAHPVVRTFHSLATGRPVRSETLLLAQCWGADAVEGIADLTQIDIPDLRALQERLLSGACKAAA
jgi:HD-GYP domain-containing protein (c-di-GMP phosphodiesterase class II)